VNTGVREGAQPGARRAPGCQGTGASLIPERGPLRLRGASRLNRAARENRQESRPQTVSSRPAAISMCDPELVLQVGVRAGLESSVP